MGPGSTTVRLYSGPDIGVAPGDSLSTTVTLHVGGCVDPGTYTLMLTVSLDGLRISRDSFELEVVTP